MRNLMYLVAPFGNYEWFENFHMLARYHDTFDGKKVLMIATDNHMVDPMVVIHESEQLGFMWDQVLIRPNDPLFGETTHFAAGLREFQETDGYTFYAHARGVTEKYESQSKLLQNRRIWRNLAYHYNLHDVGLINHQLGNPETVCTGALRHPHPGLRGTRAQWWYRGAYFWFKNKAVFNHLQWNMMRMHFYGAEAYLGEKFLLGQSACTWGQDLYGLENFDLKEWKRRLRNLDPLKVEKGIIEGH